MKAYSITQSDDYRGVDKVAMGYLYDSYHSAAKDLSMRGFTFHKLYVNNGYFHDVWINPEFPLIRFYIFEYDIKKSEDF